MRKANVFVKGVLAGILQEFPNGKYEFQYQMDYQGSPVSLAMPIKNSVYEFNQFPPFFEGLLPEGALLEGLLRKYKIDKNDYFGQLLQVGQDVVGAVTIQEVI